VSGASMQPEFLAGRPLHGPVKPGHDDVGESARAA
jgi:hypothetical protein